MGKGYKYKREAKKLTFNERLRELWEALHILAEKADEGDYDAGSLFAKGKYFYLTFFNNYDEWYDRAITRGESYDVMKSMERIAQFGPNHLYAIKNRLSQMK